MNGKKSKALRRETYVVDPTLDIVHPTHPGRKHGGVIGPDPRPGAKTVMHAETNRKLNAALKQAFGQETSP